MRANHVIDWDAITRDPRFQTLHRRKRLLLWSLMGFSVFYYFLLPIGAAYYQDLFKIRVSGVVNVGLLFALSEFVVAWAIAWIYAKRATLEFDPLAAQIVADYADHTPRLLCSNSCSNSGIAGSMGRASRAETPKAASTASVARLVRNG